jgi:tetratricopeptide (TPR) repeat protein
MAQPSANEILSPSPDQRRVAAGKFERANQVVATGHYDYAILLLRECCRLDPAALPYRQALRRTEKAKFRNNLRGSRLSGLTAWIYRMRLRAARARGDFMAMLEHSESILARNPWDVAAHSALADAARELGLLDLAVWSLEQARHKKQGRDMGINRTLAQLYEQQGNFTQAMKLWDVIRQADPKDASSADKIHQLAVKDTMARGSFPRQLGEGSSADFVLPGRPAAPAVPAPGQSTEPRDHEADVLKARLREDPTRADLYLQLARLLRRANQLEQAKIILQEGLGATSNAFELAAELADLEIEPFRQNLALTEERLRQPPEDPQLRKFRIQLRKEINTRELDLFRQKADRYPREMAHRYEMGIRLLRGGQFEEAFRELQMAREDLRFRWQSLRWLGHCAKSMKNSGLALRLFEESLQLLPPSETNARKDLLFELAQNKADAGDWNRAMALARELAALDPDYRSIGHLLAEWQARGPKQRIAQ